MTYVGVEDMKTSWMNLRITTMRCCKNQTTLSQCSKSKSFECSIRFNVNKAAQPGQQQERWKNKNNDEGKRIYGGVTWWERLRLNKVFPLSLTFTARFWWQSTPTRSLGKVPVVLNFRCSNVPSVYSSDKSSKMRREKGNETKTSDGVKLPSDDAFPIQRNLLDWQQISLYLYFCGAIRSTLLQIRNRSDRDQIL